MTRILYLAHRVPFPPNRGDTIRSANVLRKLAQIGEVHVGCLSDGKPAAQDLAELANLAASHKVVRRSKPLVLAGAEAVLAGKPVSVTAFHSPTLEQWVQSMIECRKIDCIVVFSGQMGQYVPADFQGRVVIDLCDVDSAKFENYAAAGQRVWVNAREARLLAREEERLAKRADATVLISENEAALFKSRLQSPELAHIHVVGNGIDAGLFDPKWAAPAPELAANRGPHFVFTGQMDYPPNEAAALWAIEHFLPAIHASEPQAELHIVGRAPTKSLLAHDGVPGLTIWGEVPDVRPFMAAAHAVVVPLQIARGVQNKVLEAMAMARPVLVTPEAATGISAQDGAEWIVCPAEAQEMVRELRNLLSDPDRASKMGAMARRFVIAHHDWDAMVQPLAALVLAQDEEDRDAA